MFSATVVADSITGTGKRLTTMVWRYPRFIHSEVMTHRALSRNAASSRAIPVAKMIKQVLQEPAGPVYWGKNQAGMQAAEELTGDALEACKRIWIDAGISAVKSAEALMSLGLHKQIANRLLEPWMWMTAIISGTSGGWGNMYNLRCHPDAQPEYKHIATMALQAHKESKPIVLEAGQWHLPYVRDEDREIARQYPDPMFLPKISAARCARVSYLNHDGTAPDFAKDLDLHDKLIKAPHASPFEHPATPMFGRHGNFDGWKQYRQFVPNEYQPTYPGI